MRIARRVRAGSDRGMVTVEMAAAIPVLLVLVLAGVYAVRVADMQTRCVDAAREVARAAARDDPRAAALGRMVLPGPVDIAVRRDKDTVTATVTVRVRPVGGTLPSLTISAHATAAVESVSGAETSPASSRSP